ncbi:hypothetical protein F5144DRAFT_650905 [Chaetomium tenue]|uniref:Uncharacterized protein n=1 Tax=Chaetomium tenue TaxID=1854479 RepID=A0ACB7PAY4_9PEZI|nr:hypothetical protein F5144DRAFT_650905 [Chaetomium globosum]
MQLRHAVSPFARKAPQLGGPIAQAHLAGCYMLFTWRIHRCPPTYSRRTQAIASFGCLSRCFCSGLVRQSWGYSGLRRPESGCPRLSELGTPGPGAYDGLLAHDDGVLNHLLIFDARVAGNLRTQACTALASAGNHCRPAYSPDFEAESSFPERHLDDDKTPAPGVEPDRYRPAAAKRQPRQVFEPSLPTLYARDWPGENQPLARDSHITSHPALPVNNAIPTHFPQTTAPLQGEWSSFSEQPHDGRLWQSTRPELSVDDDSDSIQSRNDSLEEFCLPMPTLPSTQKPRRRSSHRVTKPAKASSGSIPSHHPAARPERPYIPDFDYNTDWFDASDAAAAFFPQINHDQPAAASGGEIEIAYRDSSSSSKVDSKRIAHKLSEKTRRNRLTIAIREIQKLLPSGADGDDQTMPQAQKDADFVVRPGVPSSKLDIVEMAVGFIRDLKERNKETARRLREAERALEQCQCRRARGDTVSSSSSLNLPAMGSGAG